MIWWSYTKTFTISLQFYFKKSEAAENSAVYPVTLACCSPWATKTRARISDWTELTSTLPGPHRSQDLIPSILVVGNHSLSPCYLWVLVMPPLPSTLCCQLLKLWLWLFITWGLCLLSLRIQALPAWDDMIWLLCFLIFTFSVTSSFSSPPQPPTCSVTEQGILSHNPAWKH